MDDPDARKYVSGVAVHWYLDPIVSPITLDLTHDAYPDLFILQTEASQGHVNLGNWELANHYAFDIIEVKQTTTS